MRSMRRGLLRRGVMAKKDTVSLAKCPSRRIE
jgi:hypothetical protein